MSRSLVDEARASVATMPASSGPLAIAMIGPDLFGVTWNQQDGGRRTKCGLQRLHELVGFSLDRALRLDQSYDVFDAGCL